MCSSDLDGAQRAAWARRVVACCGDPMQPLAAGLALGAAAHEVPLLLAGGSQMAAVAALALALAPPALRPRLGRWVALGTTGWVAGEAGSDLALLLRRIGERWGEEPLAFAADLRFRGPVHPALADYERGYVKEGVGAGGLALLWQLSGRSPEALARLCDRACHQLLAEAPEAVGCEAPREDAAVELAALAQACADGEGGPGLVAAAAATRIRAQPGADPVLASSSERAGVDAVEAGWAAPPVAPYGPGGG